MSQRQAPRLQPSKTTSTEAVVKLVLVNNTVRTIETYVEGPSTHPFSYGITFSPSRKRTENWPVGTRLYKNVKGSQKRFLVEITQEQSGRIIEITSKSN